MRYFLDEAGVDELVKQYKDYVDNLNPEPVNIAYDIETHNPSKDSIEAVSDNYIPELHE